VESADGPGGAVRASSSFELETAETAMGIRIVIAVALMAASAVQAAEPPPAATAGTRPPATRPPLKLGIGDVRKYMMPNEYRAAINAPDTDKTTVVVQGERTAAPLQSELPQPVGLAAVYSLFRHPTTAWRLFVPDTSAYAPQSGPPDVVPAREFRWGP
jgi:hypothetical protein